MVIVWQKKGSLDGPGPQRIPSKSKFSKECPDFNGPFALLFKNDFVQKAEPGDIKELKAFLERKRPPRMTPSTIQAIIVGAEAWRRLTSLQSFAKEQKVMKPLGFLILQNTSTAIPRKTASRISTKLSSACSGSRKWPKRRLVMEMPWNEWQELVLTARLIALDHLKALEKDSKDRAAISYFHGLEFKRWFATPAKEPIDAITLWHRKPIAVAKSLKLVDDPPQFAIPSKPARHCKQCGAEIPRGRIYCNDCKIKRKIERNQRRAEKRRKQRAAKREKARLELISQLTKLRSATRRLTKMIEKLKKE